MNKPHPNRRRYLVYSAECNNPICFLITVNNIPLNEAGAQLEGHALIAKPYAIQPENPDNYDRLMVTNLNTKEVQFILRRVVIGKQVPGEQLEDACAIQQKKEISS